MSDIYDHIEKVRRTNQPAALVTVISTKGSVPRETGAKMLVYGDGKIYGTIGGSAVEAIVIEEAQQSIRDGKHRKIRHDLMDKDKNDTGMICGGEMEFFIEPVAAAPHLLIFGGGHVALHLAQLASRVGFMYTIIEDRPEFATKERFPDAREIIILRPEEIGDKIAFSPQDYAAIVTRSHELDYIALKQVLASELKYIGLIASKIKKKDIFERLTTEGHTDKKLKQIHSPIGIDIAAQTPEEIAVSIVAELIQVKNK
jgi:xanthine dehydrogenase accessory factor